MCDHEFRGVGWALIDPSIHSSNNPLPHSISPPLHHSTPSPTIHHLSNNPVLACPLPGHGEGPATPLVLAIRPAKPWYIPCSQIWHGLNPGVGYVSGPVHSTRAAPPAASAPAVLNRSPAVPAIPGHSCHS